MNMSLTTRFTNLARRARQLWGTTAHKQQLWNSEFQQGRWDCIENTSDDPICECLAKYARGGSVLDLGCGSGNTGCELESSVYSAYTGVDISDVAIANASRRSAELGRAAKRL